MMASSPDIWIAFARTFSMLFVVLAVLVVLFYLARRFSGKSGGRGQGIISVLSIHHLSPKEKIVLLEVLNEKILIGVTPQKISTIKTIDSDIDLTPQVQTEGGKFSDLLSRKLGKAVGRRGKNA